MSDPGVRLLELFRENEHEQLFGTRASPGGPYTWSMYGDIRVRVEKLAHFLTSRVRLPPRQEHPLVSVAICATNRPEWLLADFACAISGFVSVGVHSSWTPDQIVTVMTDAHVAVAVLEPAVSARVLEVLPRVPGVQFIISMGDSILASGPNYALSDILAGPDIPDPIARIQPDVDIFTIIYSSGTTGAPKGIPMSRRRWHEDSDTPSVKQFRPFSCVSYSALAHAMDRGNCWQAVYNGGRVGFAREDYDGLVADCQAINPAIVVAMPCFWGRMYTTFQQALKRLAREYVTALVGTSSDELEELVRRASWSKFEFSPIANLSRQAFEEFRNVLGTRLKAAVTGGAHTAKDVLDFMGELFEPATVIDAYGTTEVPGISNNGRLGPTVELKLVDAPEQGYLHTDKPFPRGEIVVRRRGSEMVTKYWGDSPGAVAATAANYKDGWYYTGDIGSFDPVKQTLTIIDRRSNFLEIYLGKFSVWIPIDPLEATYSESSLVERIYIHSDRAEHALIAVVVPRTETTAAEVLKDLREIASAKSLASYEVPKAVILSNTKWSAATGELASTQKLIRGVLRDKYEREFVAEYARLERRQERAEAIAKEAAEHGYDWFRYEFVGWCDGDAALLNGLYEACVRTISALRAVGERSAASIREEGSRLRSELEEAIRGRSDALKRGTEALGVLKARVMRIYGKLEQLNATRDPEYNSLEKQFGRQLEDLERACKLVQVSLPWQIKSGTIRLPPSQRENGVALEQGGLPSWRVVCEGCGEEIEWGESGSGRERWRDLDCDPTSGTWCADCYGFFKDSLTRRLIVRETEHPIWMHNRAIAGLASKTLAEWVVAAFSIYAHRPCILAEGNWLSYGDVIERAMRIGGAAQEFGKVGFAGVLTVEMTVAAIGCARASVPIVAAEEADFVFTPDAPATAGRQQPVREAAAVNEDILRKARSRGQASDPVVNVFAGVKASVDVVAAVLQGLLNCGGRVVVVSVGTVAEIAKVVRPTLLVVGQEAMNEIKGVCSIEELGGRLRYVAALGDPAGGHHLVQLMAGRVAWSIDDLPPVDE
jgi:long-subunit acyl-CoA synthetase (AMP-forming)